MQIAHINSRPSTVADDIELVGEAEQIKIFQVE